MDKQVYITKCPDYSEASIARAVDECLAAFGGVAGIAGDSPKKILVKPNLLLPRGPEDNSTTHPAVVTAVARRFVEAGHSVVIADSCGGVYNKSILSTLYKKTGMEFAAEKAGATLNYDTSEVRRDAIDGEAVKEFTFIRPAVEADLIISVAKLKTHGMTYYTGAVKNLFGTLPGLAKVSMHQRFTKRERFCEMIVDIERTLRPAFSIIDGIEGMEGKGPSGGRTKKAGVMLAARNPHALDLAGCSVMGLDPRLAPTIVAGQKRGLAPKTADELEILGTPIGKVVTKFEPASSNSSAFIGLVPSFVRPFAEGLFFSYPKVDREKCVGCGNCARSCPREQIVVANGKATIYHDRCIKCYCCHELCPVKAISFTRRANKRGKTHES